ncbi:hypothetical protein V0R39_10490 [Pseudomonas inefficax]|nr:hypothetical protein [Pseudomonas inefficax]MEE1907453.1 hypothetical protein [Pseudomonas inefficax]MEE1984917.1 hypothetical protein [Pseudomonas inefficax]
MIDNMPAAIADLERRTAAGLALLSEEMQATLADTPTEFLLALGAALFDVGYGQEQSDCERGVHYGRALGVLAAGAALGVISQGHLEELMASLPTVKGQ